MIPCVDNANTFHGQQDAVSYHENEGDYYSIERNLHAKRRQKAFQLVLTALGGIESMKPNSSASFQTCARPAQEKIHEEHPIVLAQNSIEMKLILKKQREKKSANKNYEIL